MKFNNTNTHPQKMLFIAVFILKSAVLPGHRYNRLTSSCDHCQDLISLHALFQMAVYSPIKTPFEKLSLLIFFNCTCSFLKF